MRPPSFAGRRYDTRLDRFRVREKIALARWAEEAGMARTQLGAYRSGSKEPWTNAVADLVRAASRILGRPVKASELFDLGEDEPVASTRRLPLAPDRNRSGRKVYASRFDALLRRIDWPPNALAREVGMTRQTLRDLRTQRAFSMVSTIRRIVSALRRMGYDVRASDVADVGED